MELKQIDDGERVQVRRMSLAEFTGLEEYETQKERQKRFIAPGTPIKEDVVKGPSATSLIDTYSNRRRSVATCSLEDINVSTSPNMSERVSPKELPKHISFHDIYERINNLRKRLEKTMNDLPNQSPRKSFDMENEKAELLSESRRLAGACRTMASIAIDDEGQKKWPQVIDDVVETADRVTSVTERIIHKSNSVFQAQLMTAKTDQMLKSLLEVLQSLEDRSDENTKKLAARNTTLTATITQLISAVRSV